MLSVKYKHNTGKAEHFLNRIKGINVFDILERYGQAGVNALASATPVDTGKTASSWSYEITYDGETYSIVWHNSNVAKGYAPIAVLLDAGHGTATGGYVAGRNFIKPALQPIFDQIARDAWAEVTKSW